MSECDLCCQRQASIRLGRLYVCSTCNQKEEKKADETGHGRDVIVMSSIRVTPAQWLAAYLWGAQEEDFRALLDDMAGLRARHRKMKGYEVGDQQKWIDDYSRIIHETGCYPGDVWTVDAAELVAYLNTCLEGE